ncbi:MerR family transcriptional regulator [Variovorax sp. OV329]|uniref:MerR family transcriptional regulator n=1 Tax=Variovorax sp. OV329 TaxID=1882825 RepID=UPI0008F2B858|nr:MerR family transcriptional regulator [Variovorax sp. OV329]SFL93491.1 transcriptional regulator, MerR family [Variovorax sp. OV329]
MEKALPSIPVKRYFTIGEVAELCGVKPHVLRYWEQEFTQLRPMKRRGNRRYYQHHEVLMIRRIRDLLYDQGFTISGARNKLQELVASERDRRKSVGEGPLEGVEAIEIDQEEFEAALHEEEDAREAEAEAADGVALAVPATRAPLRAGAMSPLQQLRRELFEIRELLTLNR